MSEVTDHHTVSLSEQAAEWVVRLSDSQISTAQQADFEAWLAQDIRHREAYEQISRLWQSVTPQRRRKHRPAGLLASIVLVLIGIYCLPLSTWLADERTATEKFARWHCLTAVPSRWIAILQPMSSSILTHAASFCIAAAYLRQWFRCSRAGCSSPALHHRKP